METLLCLRCEHVWLPRVMGRPKACPACHSLAWDQPRKDIQQRSRVCSRCGHGWVSHREERPQMCPHCRSLIWDQPLTKDEQEARKILLERGHVGRPLSLLSIRVEGMKVGDEIVGEGIDPIEDVKGLRSWCNTIDRVASRMRYVMQFEVVSNLPPKATRVG